MDTCPMFGVTMEWGADPRTRPREVVSFMLGETRDQVPGGGQGRPRRLSTVGTPASHPRE